MTEPGVNDETPLSISVNLLWCIPGVVGGSEDYMVRQLAGLRTVRDDEITLHCLPDFVEAHPELVGGFTIDEAQVAASSRARRILAEHTWLLRRTRAADLVHHGGGTVPLAGVGRTVVTVHDLQYLTYPEYFSPSRRAYLSTMMPRSVRRADVVAVPTDYVRSTVVNAYGVDPDHVVVVPHGVDLDLRRRAPDGAEMRARYGLGEGPVLVLPAITHPHKGHEFLLEVMARYWPDPDLRLVLIGGRGAAEDDVGAAIERLGLAGRVIRPGRVPDADRDGLVAVADALVFPTQYEGFGAPVIEAMALGTPVIASDQPAVAEVLGDAGLIRPLEPDAWADALDEVLRRRDELVAAGTARVRRFSTTESGRALSAAYDLAVGS